MAAFWPASGIAARILVVSGRPALPALALGVVDTVAVKMSRRIDAPLPSGLLPVPPSTVRCSQHRSDITEREQAELALAERNPQLALAAQAALVDSYAYEVDLETAKVSEGYCAIHGLIS